MNPVRLIPALVAIILAGQAIAEPSLTPHSAQYKVKISVLSGQLNTELHRTETGYVANHIIKPTGLSKLITRGTMDVTSEFVGASDGIRTVRFHSVDTIRDDPNVDLRFDWATNTASGTVGEEDVVLQLEGISHDSVSIQYALMQDLLNGSLGETYVLFDIDKMRVVNVTRVGEKEVKTRAGRFMAVGIQHQRVGSSRITTMWCVEELGYLPVIIEQHRKGKTKFRASLVKYAPIPE